ncbi:MAG: MauE/DoxX family redox-associated membrane protein [Iamia sp.]
MVFMAATQASDPSGFVDVLVTYDVGGRAVAWALAAALVAGEAVGGLGLLSTQIGRRRRGADVALAVALLWSALGVQAFARGLALESCGCFGVHLAQPLRWWVLLQDAEFVALAVLSRRRARRTPVPTPTVHAVEV